MAWQPAIADPAPGRILAPANRQLAWLDLDAPRPRLLTRFEPPAYVTDVAALPGAQVAVIAVSMAAVPLPTGGPTPAPVTGSAAIPYPTSLGSDLLSVDLTSGQVSTLVARGDAHESLGAPAWQGGGSSVLFERQDQSSPGLAYAGVSTVSYPTRIEMVQPDGSGRTVLVQDGRQPTAAPDGGSIAFLRTSADGSALMLRTTSDASERVLVPIGQFRDLASPRYSPQGDQLGVHGARNVCRVALSRLAGHGAVRDQRRVGAWLSVGCVADRSGRLGHAPAGPTWRGRRYRCPGRRTAARCSSTAGPARSWSTWRRARSRRWATWPDTVRRPGCPFRSGITSVRLRFRMCPC